MIFNYASNFIVIYCDHTFTRNWVLKIDLNFSNHVLRQIAEEIFEKSEINWNMDINNDWILYKSPSCIQPPI